MSDPYARFRIKEYDHGVLQVSEYQNYLGRTILWCKRPDANELTDATREETDEMMCILRKLRKALDNVFQPDLLNFAFLGNETRHLHCHIVPRYKELRIFADQGFLDHRWGKNWITDKNFIVDERILERIIVLLRGQLL